MTFNPTIWFPIAVVVTVINVVDVAFAGTPPHATAHAVLALGFGLWAQQLRRRRGVPPSGDASDLQAGLEALDAQVTKLRQELTETQERLDFTERLLAQGREGRRVGGDGGGGGGGGGPERWG